MNLDKNQIKNLISQAKSNEILVLAKNSLEKDSSRNCLKDIDNFMKKSEDYVITVIKR